MVFNRLKCHLDHPNCVFSDLGCHVTEKKTPTNLLGGIWTGLCFHCPMHKALRTCLIFALCWLFFRFTPVEAYEMPRLRTTILYPPAVTYNAVTRRIHVPLTTKSPFMRVWNASQFVQGGEQSGYNAVRFECKTLNPYIREGVDYGHVRVFTQRSDESNMLFYNHEELPYLWLSLRAFRSSLGSVALVFDAQCMRDSKHSSLVACALMLAAQERGPVLFGGGSVLDLPHTRESKGYRNACMRLPQRGGTLKTFLEFH